MDLAPEISFAFAPRRWGGVPDRVQLGVLEQVPSDPEETTLLEFQFGGFVHQAHLLGSWTSPNSALLPVEHVPGGCLVAG